jgi:hypothetical protein
LQESASDSRKKSDAACTRYQDSKFADEAITFLKEAGLLRR